MRYNQGASALIWVAILLPLWVQVIAPEDVPKLKSRQGTALGSSDHDRVAVKPAIKTPRPMSFEQVDKKMISARDQIGTCLLKNPEIQVSKIELRASWEPSGGFNKIAMNPDPGNLVSSCLREMIATWEIAPHPGLRPFTYSVILSL